MKHNEHNSQCYVIYSKYYECLETFFTGEFWGLFICKINAHKKEISYHSCALFISLPQKVF